MKEKEEAEENKCNNFYISDSIGRARMVQQFRRSGRRRRRSTVDRINVHTKGGGCTIKFISGYLYSLYIIYETHRRKFETLLF